MQVKIKKLYDKAVVPQYAKNGDAGMDLTAVSRIYDKYGNVTYGTGLAFEIPQGYVGLLFARSSVCKYDLSLSNAVGVLDSGYRGEVMFKFKPTLAFTSYYEDDIPTEDDTFEAVLAPSGLYNIDLNEDSMDIEGYSKAEQATHYQVGDRIGQIIIMPYPQIEFTEVDELSTTERGDGGFGSTNKQ